MLRLNVGGMGSSEIASGARGTNQSFELLYLRAVR